MGLILRLGLASCAFYLAGAALLEGAALALARWRGHFGLDATRAGWTVLFGLIWFLAFQLAWRMVATGLVHSRRM